MFNEYPYRNLTDINLDWILKQIKDLTVNLEDFVKLNTVKYADPIDWNISKQYEANTVVVNEFTGVAYLSTKPVPAGVDVTNTEYWTPIFTLDFVNLNKNITMRNDGNNNLATFTSDVNDWLIVGGQLYKVIRDIVIGDTYATGINIQIYSVELFVHDYLNQVIMTIGNLTDLTTSDKTNIVNAINSVLSDINTNIGDLDDLDTSDKSSVVNAINSVNTELTYILNDFVTPEMYGAVGNGITDDTQAIIDAFDSGKNIVGDLHHTYLISSTIIKTVTDRIISNCNFKAESIASTTDTLNMFEITANNATFYNCTFTSSFENLPVINYLNGVSSGVASNVKALMNVSDSTGLFIVSNCKFYNCYGIHCMHDAIINNCYFYDVEMGITTRNSKCIVDNCYIRISRLTNSEYYHSFYIHSCESFTGSNITISESGSGTLGNHLHFFVSSVSDDIHAPLTLSNISFVGSITAGLGQSGLSRLKINGITSDSSLSNYLFASSRGGTIEINNAYFTDITAEKLFIGNKKITLNDCYLKGSFKYVGENHSFEFNNCSFITTNDFAYTSESRPRTYTLFMRGTYIEAKTLIQFVYDHHDNYIQGCTFKTTTTPETLVVDDKAYGMITDCIFNINGGGLMNFTTEPDMAIDCFFYKSSNRTYNHVTVRLT